VAITVELGGLALVAFGVWQVFEPAAYIVGGLGVVLWTQGVVRR